MDSRLNYGDGFSFPQGNFQFTGSWVPATPDKPVQVRSNPTPVLYDQGNRQLGILEPELAPFPESYSQAGLNSQHLNSLDQLRTVGYGTLSVDNGNNLAATEMFNHIAADSYSQVQCNETAAWNNNLLASLSVQKNVAYEHASTSRPIYRTTSMYDNQRSFTPNLHSLVNSWKEPNLAELLLAKTHSSNSYSMGFNGNLSQSHQDVFHVPRHHNYDLNSPPVIEANATSNGISSHSFTPITSDQADLESSSFPKLLNLSQQIGSNEIKEKHHEPIMTVNPKNQHNAAELLHDILDSSSAVISTSFEVPKDLQRGNENGIDLNSTPPQKPPKRRKHRPKVVVEGKTKRNPKPATKGVTDSYEKPTGKRKYVRKKGLQGSAPEQVGSTGVTTYSSTGTGPKSCRRQLKFGLENTANEGPADSVPHQETRTINETQVIDQSYTCIGAAKASNGVNMMCGTRTALNSTQHNRLLVENQHPRAVSDLTNPIKQMTGYQSISERQAIAEHITSTENMQMGNLNVNAREKDMRLQQHVQAERIRQSVFLAQQNRESLLRARQLMSQTTTRSGPEALPYLLEVRGSKRERCHVEQTMPLIRNTLSELLCQEMFIRGHCHQTSNSFGVVCPETHKRIKTTNEIQEHTHGMGCTVASVKVSGQQKSHVSHNLIGYASQKRQKMLGSNFERNNMTNGVNIGTSKFIGDQYLHLIAARMNLSKQQTSETHSCVERMGEKSRTRFHNAASLMAIKNSNMLPSTPRLGPAPGGQAENGTWNANMPERQQIGRSTLLESLLSSNERMLKEQGIVKDHHQPLARRRGKLARQKFSNPIEEIIYQMVGLSINQTGERMEDRDQYALVPYKAEGTIIPYEGLELIKKRKPRPKVDLDPETDRVWKLLMGKEGNANLEGTDEEKQKWWEEERRVFRGRADSFIARMHLVQGDRRFSKWKGSVVDSVIGVFLTQNVSDHLSSSAFMSLAARFPLKSMRDRTCEWGSGSALVEEPDTCLVDAKLSSSTLYNQSHVTQHKPKEYGGNATPCIERTRLVEADSHSQGEEVISSQGSVDSTIVQGHEVIRSTSGSSSEAEDAVVGSKSNDHRVSSLVELLQMETNTFEEFYCQISGNALVQEQSMQKQVQLDVENGQHKQRLERSENLKGYFPLSNYPQMQPPTAVPCNYQLHATAESEVMEVQCFGSNSDESVSSQSSTSGEPPAQAYGSERHRPTPSLHPQELPSKQSINELCNGQPSHYDKSHEKHKSYQPKSASVVEEISKKQNNHLLESLNGEKRIRSANTQANLDSEFVEPSLKEQVHSMNMVNVEGNTNSLKIKKPKADIQKKDVVDWDSLRKEAQANCPRKERRKEQMDSLDYEALRCASFNEISETIKERGMNNLLAERIKEFLNRLVVEHGSIDLEWLRDVPPDKAKDYLLSVRGLGLKSVECVRLLTLHHLAFPVDTNVGRIAVRLGWVPLQPLPESLQLHLLELYPILESIQKYLWPRLCKLDQRTLYELHYQLITFGKVFCTKSRPNCNACPMRAECRHFASAYASARLALPGPEEQSIINVTAPSAMERSTGIVINPMPLPPTEDSSHKNAVSIIGNGEPIIEEPSTPEQEIVKVTESDIEDAFYEDPEEIPTIKLNIEEFSVNLQNFMQANMEIQEGDMSKALVALDPGAASIPTTKLKNISRLRTEHHVYELPDSHPLVDGMDRREPDDPSHYLLAIWTPGETANSVQLPGRQCNSKESNQLCNEQTCFSCNSIREANSQTVRGTLLIPCRTAMRGSFPLNGTYFQVNEMFADHESSLKPIDVPRSWLWNLPRRIVYFGTSVSSIFKGLSTQEIQYCFWKGFVCVRGFDQKTRAPRPLIARLHFPASKLKTVNEKKREAQKQAMA